MFLSASEPQNLPDDSLQSEEEVMGFEANQSIVFPYMGPPGAGPGLLGSKPGADKLDYLIALEHYAFSLKSALSVAADLKNAKNKEFDDHIVYDSTCDTWNGMKGSV